MDDYDYNLGAHDPYNGMETGNVAIKPDVMPEGMDFEFGKNGNTGAGTFGASGGLYKSSERNRDAAKKLGGVEDAAVNNDNKNGINSSQSDVRQNEEKAGGLYVGKKVGIGKNAQNSRGENQKDKKRRKGFLKKGLPFLIIFGVIIGAGGIMSGTQLFQPFSLVAQFQESYNSMHTSANLRSNVFFKMQMDSGRVKNPIKSKIFTSDTFKITNKQKSKLAQQGIEYDEDFEGSGVRVLKYDDGSGNTKIITADVKTAEKIGNGAVDFKSYYATNADFNISFNRGSMTWKGVIANWFGTSTNKFLGSNNLSRNSFDDFRNEVAKNGGDTMETAKKLMGQNAEEIKDGGVEMSRAEEETTDADGNPTTREVDSENMTRSQNYNDNAKLKSPEAPQSSTISRTSMTADSIRTKLDDISGKVQKGTNVACTIMNTIGAVSLLVTGAEALQIINLTTGYFEAVDKTKAGYGDDTPIHDLTNALNEQKENKNDVLKSSDVAWNSVDENANFVDGKLATITTETVTTKKSAMQSNGVGIMYGGKSDPNDASVQSFNFTNSINRIAGGLGTSMTAFTGCTMAKIAANAVSAVTGGIEIASCILGALGAPFTLGMSATACGPLVARIARGVVFSIAIGVAVAGVIAAITPWVTSALTRDLIGNIGGEDLGNALASGANMYQGNVHRANGGSLSTINEYKSFAMAQQQVIAENAKYERETLSPFDLTSKNTFLGTFMTQMMSFATTSSLMNMIITGGSVVSSAVLAMTPGATAYDVAEGLPDSIEEYEKTCPYLASIGAIGDQYCNPYSITDTSTIGVDPYDVIEAISDNFEDTPEADNVKIKKDSHLAKYIVYCDNRESAFGIVDNNIASSIGDFGTVNTGNSFFDTTANSAIGAIPVLGDVIDVVSNEQQMENIGYIGGESCVAGNDLKGEYQRNMDSYENEDGTITSVPESERIENYGSQSPDWNVAKYYQRFIEDQSLAESMGLIEESAVSVFLDEYYKENPLDNSYEGILARKSGLSKETVVAILDLVDYANYVANYDPATRYAFGEPKMKSDGKPYFDDENVLASNYGILFEQISYADVRNRSFAI